jgi:uncharacterized membrane protein YeaQ/YmgE (transglycosylase-associated protein family)
MGLIISWIVLGLIAGFIASKIIKRTGSGLVLDIFLGMIGAAVGGLIFPGLFGMSGITGLNIWSIIVSVIGAIVVIWIYEAVLARRSRSVRVPVPAIAGAPRRRRGQRRAGRIRRKLRHTDDAGRDAVVRWPLGFLTLGSISGRAATHRPFRCVY